MIYFQIKAIKTVYVDQLKSRELKNYYLLGYLKEIVKFKYPFSIHIHSWLKEKMNFQFKNLQEFNLYFQSLGEEDICLIFKIFPEIYPFNLIFLMDDKNEAINKPSFTELVSIDKESRFIELILFNNIKDKIQY